jgi:hypothetical protein
MMKTDNRPNAGALEHFQICEIEHDPAITRLHGCDHGLGESLPLVLIEVSL